MIMITIWGRADAPNVRKVLWCAEELGVDYRRLDLGGRFGGTDTPDYRAKNPNGLIPTLEEEDGFVLWEAHAIMKYLCAKAGDERLYPADARGRAVVDQWLDWQAIHQAAAVRGLGRRFRPNAPPSTPAELAEAVGAVETAFAILEARLERSAHAGGEAFTIVDIPLAIGVQRWLQLPLERRPFPAIEAWFERLTQRPAFARVGAVSYS
jgi:glutathione S-transferase